jgi:hypothetical protein
MALQARITYPSRMNPYSDVQNFETTTFKVMQTMRRNKWKTFE